MLAKINPTKTDSWDKLKKHFEQNKEQSLISLFEKDSNRVDKFSFDFNDFYFDFSKNHITEDLLELFKSLTEEIKLRDAKKLMFSGEKINQTENRSVLHVALRNLSNNEIFVDGENIMVKVFKELSKIKDFTENLHSGKLNGYTGKRIEHIVNIGIGGSDLGPNMVTSALRPYWNKGITPHYISNVDASHLVNVLDGLNPETTLFIIASKTFTTQETMTNAHSARDWFLLSAVDEKHVKKHFVAVSTNKTKVSDFGIDVANMFEFWDWVGGRYSLWSAIGLSISCTIGFDNFEMLLKGAEEMDDHFYNAPFEKNAPTLLAIISIWYNNFYKTETHAILPYDQLLNQFSKYLQQGDMESNGKCVGRDGIPIDYQTGPIIWGEPGTNGQHAFYQLIHQGTKLIPCDFIAAALPPHKYENHHEMLIANFIAQTEALMMGKSRKSVEEELKIQGLTNDEIERLAPYKVFEGNCPTTTILLKKLTPRNLGSLIALYEHKIFVQGIIWNIFSFDQWGVELGKQLAGNVLLDIKNKSSKSDHDASTSQLITKYHELRKT